MKEQKSTYFQTGYQLGLAGNAKALKKELKDLKRKLKTILKSRKKAIKKANGVIDQTVDSYTKLTSNLKVLVKDLIESRTAFLRQLTVEWELLKEMGNTNNNHLEQVRTDSLDIIDQTSGKVAEVMKTIDDQVLGFSIEGQIQAFIAELKNHLDEVIANLKDAQLQLREGYSRGVAIRSQLADLDNDDKPSGGGGGSGDEGGGPAVDDEGGDDGEGKPTETEEGGDQ